MAKKLLYISAFVHSYQVGLQFAAKMADFSWTSLNVDAPTLLNYLLQLITQTCMLFGGFFEGFFSIFRGLTSKGNLNVCL